MLLDRRIPFTYILNKIKHDVLTVLVVAALIIFVTTRYAFALPEIPLQIPLFLGTAISILLSFKLNQSYDRWWEARKIWGSIVNDSRTLVLQLQGFVTSGHDVRINRIAYRQIAWCFALCEALRGLDPMKEVSRFISPEEMKTISAHNNKPLALLQQHARDIKELHNEERLDIFSHVQLDNTLVRLCDAQGRAERIKSTVFPVTYRKFLHFIIYIFVITLSVSLNNMAAYFELPVLTLIASAFFLLEKSATHMQDPFEDRPTDTAMTAISTNIEINLKQLIGDSNIPVVAENNSYYIK